MDFVGNLVENAFAQFAERDLLPELLDRLDEAAVAKKLPVEACDAFLPALFAVAETLPDQMGFGQAPFLSAWRTAAWYLRTDGRTLEKHRTYGTGPAYRKLGGRVVYALEDLKAWADRGAKTSTSDPGAGTVLPAKRHAPIPYAGRPCR